VSEFLGGGVGYRRAHRSALLGAGPGPDVLEVMPEHFFAHPEELDALAERYPLVFHSVSLSVGTAVSDPRGDELTRTHLERLRPLVARGKPLFLSDHLAFTRAPNGTDLGHLCPLPCTEEAYTLVAERVCVWQDVLDVPIALENIAHPFLWPGDVMSEPRFLQRLCEETGCGLHLDVTNLLYDARNFARSPEALLMDYPLEHAWALHLAGGIHSQRERFWHDTHDQPVDEEVFALLPSLRGVAPLRAAIVERDRRLPALGELVSEAQRAAALLRAP
jgi:uncharacterized protein (UPF0276 family)